ncbi:hypothetical protein BDB00DRAFT_845691 [Zychaea mexicana]|uniref:uncharacterized protein n=1 Tax=Zychaea mexicana TaxID=64656 RepID=UPI0022FDE5FF|nr:uncharacterized protein BDB00DRAFT_845691 [Zychaea mexicana]KAI9489001.1 hypothetical protein BDB00DRAFT_845691 [Zychaea mexicana]
MTNVLQNTRVMVDEYMSRFDPSHDMHHVDRVCRLALQLAQQDAFQGKEVDLTVVELAALCHDIGDRKYSTGQEKEEKSIEQFLTRQGYPKAALIQKIVDHVGYSKELGWSKEDADSDWRDTCLELHA